MAAVDGDVKRVRWDELASVLSIFVVDIIAFPSGTEEEKGQRHAMEAGWKPGTRSSGRNG